MGGHWYKYFRSVLFMLPPEMAHHAALLGIKMFPPRRNLPSPRLKITLAGMALDSPIGLAAGFDKDASAVDALFRIGFAAVETGTVTPLPQAGNPRPRLFRLIEDEAVINRMGFPGRGLEYVVRRLASDHIGEGVLGVNIGANKDSADRRQDYQTCAARFLPLANYLTINVSSPNTVGLRDLQAGSELYSLTQSVVKERDLWYDESRRFVPIFVKLAPDLDHDALKFALDGAIDAGATGFVLTNTTITRPSSLRGGDKQQTGGLSGKPLAALSLQHLMWARQHLGPDVPLVSAGGVFTGADVLERMLHGANAVQLYTAMVYRGPGIVNLLHHELLEAMDEHGIAQLGDIKGLGA